MRQCCVCLHKCECVCVCVHPSIKSRRKFITETIGEHRMQSCEPSKQNHIHHGITGYIHT